MPTGGRHLAPPGTNRAGWAVLIVLFSIAFGSLAVLGLSSLVASGAQDLADRPPRTSPASTLAVHRDFTSAGVEDWRAFPGTLLTKGQLGDPTARYARVQRDPTGPPVTDPSTGLATAGIASQVLAWAAEGTTVRASARVRASRPGIRVVVRLAEQLGSRRVWHHEARVLLDPGWQEVSARHRVQRAGVPVDLEIWALLDRSGDALDIGQAQVTSP